MRTDTSMGLNKPRLRKFSRTLHFTFGVFVGLIVSLCMSLGAIQGSAILALLVGLYLLYLVAMVASESHDREVLR